MVKVVKFITINMNIFFSKIKDFFNKKEGSMMIEAVVGLTLITVGLLGVFTLVTNSIKTNRASGYRFIAANLAAEGVEIAKNIIDSNLAEGRSWNEGLKDGYYDFRYNDFFEEIKDDEVYIGTQDPNYYSYNDGTETIFKRKVMISNIETYSIKVVSEVSWIEDGDTKEIKVEDHFYNWRN